MKAYAPGISPETHPKLGAMIDFAIRYYHDFVKPNKIFRSATETERGALEDLKAKLAALPAEAASDLIQSAVFDVGRKHFPDEKKTGPDGGPGVSQEFFAALYQILLGQEKGPRFGSFVALYGVSEAIALIDKALAGELTA